MKMAKVQNYESFLIFRAVTFAQCMRPFKQTTKKEFIMRKSTLFISAVLTTFVMAMLAGVASAYQGVIAASNPTATAQTQAQEQPQVKAISQTVPADAQAVNLTPEEAAGLAAQVLGQNDLYSVEVTDLNGETVYMVTFSNGKLVYVSLDGQIRSIGEVPVQTVVVNSGGGGGNRRNNKQTQTTTSNQSSSQHQEHESHDDHEGHDD
jgi:hypothetical protein